MDRSSSSKGLSPTKTLLRRTKLLSSAIDGTAALALSDRLDPFGRHLSTRQLLSVGPRSKRSERPPRQGIWAGPMRPDFTSAAFTRLMPPGVKLSLVTSLITTPGHPSMFMMNRRVNVLARRITSIGGTRFVTQISFCL